MIYIDDSDRLQLAISSIVEIWILKHIVIEDQQLYLKIEVKLHLYIKNTPVCIKSQVAIDCYRQYFTGNAVIDSYFTNM